MNYLLKTFHIHFWHPCRAYFIVVIALLTISGFHICLVFVVFVSTAVLTTKLSYDLVSPLQPTVLTPLQLFTRSTFSSMYEVSLWDFCFSSSNHWENYGWHFVIFKSFYILTSLAIHLVDKLVIIAITIHCGHWTKQLMQGLPVHLLPEMRSKQRNEKESAGENK